MEPTRATNMGVGCLMLMIISSTYFTHVRFVENQQYGLSAPKINHPYRTFSFAHHSHVRDAADHYLIIRQRVKSSNAAPRTQTHALRATTRCRVPCSRRECARFAVKYRALWPTHNMSIIWKHMQWPRARAHTRTKHQTLNTHTYTHTLGRLLLVSSHRSDCASINRSPCTESGGP